VPSLEAPPTIDRLAEISEEVTHEIRAALDAAAEGAKARTGWIEKAGDRICILPVPTRSADAQVINGAMVFVDKTLS
jgi:hypothetical protein